MNTEEETGRIQRKYGKGLVSVSKGVRAGTSM